MKKKIFITLAILLSALMGISFFLIFKDEIISPFQKNKPAGISPIKSQENTKPKKISRKNSFQGKINQAREFIEVNQYTLASIELTKALKEDNTQIIPYLLLGEIYLRTNNQEKLKNLISQLKTKFPEDPETLVLITKKWLLDKKFSEISELLNSTAELPPTLKFYQAILLSLQNNHEKSIKILKELSRLPVSDGILKKKKQPTNEDEKNTLSIDLAAKVNNLLITYEEFKDFREGKNAHLFATISKSLSHNKEASLAQEFADLAIKEEVGYIDAWILRGYAQFLLKKYPQALKDFEHAYELDPLRAETHYFLALTFFETKKLDKAALFFEKALEYNFEFKKELQWKLLEIYGQQKKYDKVLELYKILLETESDPINFFSAVHTAVDLIKKPEIALQFTESLIQKKPEDIFAINIHAWALIANKKFIQAEEILKKAIKLAPENPRSFLNLGLLYEEKMDFQSAKEMYQKSYELGKKLPEYSSLTNLAAEKYNLLVTNSDKPETPNINNNPAHSP